VTVGTAQVALTELFAEPFSIHVHQSDADKQRYVACAEVGEMPPPPWEPTDGLALKMREQADSGESGIVSLRPDTGGATTVTLLLAGGATTTAEETSAPTGGDETPEPPGDDETPTASQPGTYASPTFGYTLGYGTTWTVEDESSTGRQDRLVLSNGTSFVTFVAAAGFGGDPAECVSGFAEEQLVDPAVSEVTAATDEAGNPLRGGTEATGSFAVYNLAAGCLAILGVAVAMTLAMGWGGRRLRCWLLIAATVAAVALLLRGVLGVALLAVSVLRGTFDDEIPVILLAIEPWFLFGGFAYGGMVVHQRNRTPSNILSH